MDLALFHPLAEANGPFATVTIDLTRIDPANTDHVELRWRELERRLRDQGTPDEVIEALADAALEDSGGSGEHGRLLIANREGLLIRHELPRRPDEEARWGLIPSLLPAVRALSSAVPHVVVRIDRTGADVEVHGGFDGQDQQTFEVQGGHDDLRKVKTGGTAQRRFENRVHDSWEQNAAAVAEQLDRIVRTRKPKVVLLFGDTRAMAYLEQHAGPELKAVLASSAAGGRAEGASEEVVQEVTQAAVAASRAQSEAELVGRFEEETGRAEAASEGLVPVVDVLQRAQVDELILVEGREHEQELWVGEQALQLGTTREDAEALGASDPVAVPADDALLWAAVCSRARVTLLDPGQANPADGVGALLRWSDESTPRSRFPSLPGHGGT